jgi:phosphoglycolate phosphatase-like HAD superfamily hydrolase
VIPDILALDFDGVLCDGRPEYFESSCRACRRLWPDTTARLAAAREDFWRLRPVIKSGWEMPLLVLALVSGGSARSILRDWPGVRDARLASLGGERDGIVRTIATTLDDVRRRWIDENPDEWLASHESYAPLDLVRRLVAEPRHTAVVTTKEGEFARRILDGWRVPIADVQGKEAGEHKCENLLNLLETGTREGRAPTLWFVEDRLETLACVVRCSRRERRLARVRLFLAAWGYTTPATRAAARRGRRIRLLRLSQFSRGCAHWPVD